MQTFDEWWRDHLDEMSSSSPRPSERAAWAAGRREGIREALATIPEPMKGTDLGANYYNRLRTELRAALTAKLEESK